MLQHATQGNRKCTRFRINWFHATENARAFCFERGAPTAGRGSINSFSAPTPNVPLISMILHVLTLRVEDLIVCPARQQRHFQEDEPLKASSTRLASPLRSFKAQLRAHPHCDNAVITLSWSLLSSAEAYCRASPYCDTAFITISWSPQLFQGMQQSCSMLGHCFHDYLGVTPQLFRYMMQSVPMPSPLACGHLAQQGPAPLPSKFY